MKINVNKTDDNPDYLGWDEDHNGDWNDFFMCPKCKKNNYITTDDIRCEICGRKIKWVNKTK